MVDPDNPNPGPDDPTPGPDPTPTPTDDPALTASFNADTYNLLGTTVSPKMTISRTDGEALTQEEKTG